MSLQATESQDNADADIANQRTGISKIAKFLASDDAAYAVIHRSITDRLGTNQPAVKRLLSAIEHRA